MWDFSCQGLGVYGVGMSVSTLRYCLPAHGPADNRPPRVRRQRCVDRPRLDRSADRQRTEGSPPMDTIARAATLYSVGSAGIRTMKSSFASATGLRGGGPFSGRRGGEGGKSGHRHLGSSSGARRELCLARNSCVSAPSGSASGQSSRSGRGPQHVTRGDLAGLGQAPQFDEQFASERHNHRRLARPLDALGSGPIPLGKPTVLLERMPGLREAGTPGAVWAV
jgi:hypothetical protein